jgi:hypothetical protein
MTTIIIVTGGRTYADAATVNATLQRLMPIHELWHGGCSGADMLARAFAMAQPYVCEVTFTADWQKHGRSAGPIRNNRMMQRGKAETEQGNTVRVVAFPGGAGTAHAVKCARAAGLVVEVVE